MAREDEASLGLGTRLFRTVHSIAELLSVPGTESTRVTIFVRLRRGPTEGITQQASLVSYPSPKLHIFTIIVNMEEHICAENTIGERGSGNKAQMTIYTY